MHWDAIFINGRLRDDLGHFQWKTCAAFLKIPMGVMLPVLYSINFLFVIPSRSLYKQKIFSLSVRKMKWITYWHNLRNCPLLWAIPKVNSCLYDYDLFTICLSIYLFAMWFLLSIIAFASVCYPNKMYLWKKDLTGI